jgi:hypothetical protein
VETIQIVLDTKLLRAADAASKRRKVNRSALIREALQEHLRRLRQLDLEERDRRGYQARPQRTESTFPGRRLRLGPKTEPRRHLSLPICTAG